MISGHNFNRNSSLPTPQDPNMRYQAPLADMGPWKEPQDVLAQRALGFNCMNYQKGVTPEPTLARHSFPDKAFLDAHCPDGLRLELMFPSCWNGENDSADHKSHVAFPDSVMSGDCPAGFDRRLPSLMYETIVATDHFKGRNGKFVISNGDPTGESRPYRNPFTVATHFIALCRLAIKADLVNQQGSVTMVISSQLGMTVFYNKLLTLAMPSPAQPPAI